jgi:ribosomal protein S18 acetylase RimI-like enzyme
MDIVKQLVEVYKKLHNDTLALTNLEASRYYSQMLAHNRIQIELDNVNVVGFIESWRLNYEQLGRVVCWKDFSALTEDVYSGNIAYVSDIWVDESKRKNGIEKLLIDKFRKANEDADYFVAEKNKSKVKYFRCYDKLTGFQHFDKLLK